MAELLTQEEWVALPAEEQKTRITEAPVDIQIKDAEEKGRKQALGEGERKLKTAQDTISQFNQEKEEIANKNKPPATSEEHRKAYEAKLAEDPYGANARLAYEASTFALGKVRTADVARRATTRKLRKEFKDDYGKYEDTLEDMLDSVKDPSSITEKSIRIMFDSLRGKSVDQQVKEAEERGAKRALENAGIVAVGDGSGAGEGGDKKTSLTKDQESERLRMQLEEIQYKELLRGLQEKDKAQNKPPRKVVAGPSGN